ncbi:hypothetical protein V1498_09700 [Peribacillus sp. SCS-26]|uniref:hypothetical protein n=1 Tax=Paraperibacillus marinus TaxID=3115295 RepID=UPI003906B250
MEIKRKLLVSGIAGALLLPSTTSFATTDVTKTPSQSQEAQSSAKSKDKLSNEQLKSLKDSVKYSKNKASSKFKNADFKVDDVEVTIITDEGQEVTDDMLQDANSYVSETKAGNTNSQAMIEANLAPDTDTYVEPEPGYAEELPGSGALMASGRRDFSDKTVGYIESAIEGVFTAITVGAGYRFGPKGATAVAGIAVTASGWINNYLDPSYTTSKCYRAYNSYTKRYHWDLYENIYSDSGLKNIKKVVIRYDLYQTLSNNVVGY